MDAQTTARTRITAAIEELCAADKTRFMGLMLLGMKKQEEPDPAKCATMQVNGEPCLTFNPEFVSGRDFSGLQWVLAHEAMHVALKHPVRMHGKDIETARIAADLAVNSILHRTKLAASAPGDELWPYKLELEDGLSLEQYYDLLYDKKDLPPPPRDDVSPSKPGESGPSDDSQDSKSQPSENADTDETQDGAMGDGDDEARFDALTIAAADGTAAAGIGSSESIGVEEALGIKQKKPAWVSKVRPFLINSTRVAYSYKRPNRRHAWRKIILPGKARKQRPNKVVVALDCSGSMARDVLHEAVANLAGLAVAQQCEVVMVPFTTKVHEDLILTFTRPPKDYRLPSGGGTRIQPVFSYVSKMERVAALVIVTDGLISDWRPTPPVKIATILVGHGVRPAPVGLNVYANERK